MLVCKYFICYQWSSRWSKYLVWLYLFFFFSFFFCGGGGKEPDELYVTGTLVCFVLMGVG